MGDQQDNQQLIVQHLKQKKNNKLDSSLYSKISSPTNSPHEFSIFSLMNAPEVWIQICSVCLVEVCQKSKQQRSFKCKLFCLWRPNDLQSSLNIQRQNSKKEQNAHRHHCREQIPTQKIRPWTKLIDTTHKHKGQLECLMASRLWRTIIIQYIIYQNNKFLPKKEQIFVIRERGAEVCRVSLTINTLSLCETPPAKTSIISHPAKFFLNTDLRTTDSVTIACRFRASSYGAVRACNRHVENNTFNRG